MPHWLTLDVGGSFTLTGLDYSVKNQANGPVKNYRIYVTDDAAIAKDPDADWGAPAATGSFHQPTANTEVQTAVFDQPVKGRYVKFEADSAVNGSDIAAASEIRVRATGDTTPAPVDPPPPAHPATPVADRPRRPEGHGGQGVPAGHLVRDGRRHAHRAARRAGHLRHQRHRRTPPPPRCPRAGDTATYTSTFADLPGLTITSAITVTAEKTVVFEVRKISGSAAAQRRPALGPRPVAGLGRLLRPAREPGPDEDLHRLHDDRRPVHSP